MGYDPIDAPGKPDNRGEKVMVLVKNKYVNRCALMMLALSIVVIIIFTFLCAIIWIYEGENYTDDDLFCKAKECFSNEIEMADFTNEVNGCFINTNLWDSGHRVVYPQAGTFMSKIVNSLPNSMHCWHPVRFEDVCALAFRFGCHSNYAYLVVVNTNESIADKMDVRCVMNNIVIVFNRELLQDF